MKAVSAEFELGHLLIANLDSRRIDVGVEFTLHCQTAGGGRGGDEVDDDLVTGQRLTPPVLANGTIEPKMIGRTISHYEITGKLGEGGMGVVYKAEDTKLDRFVALKFLPHNLNINDDERQRFVQEAKAAAAINHPNVCVIHDIQEHDAQQFIVMEFVEGKTVREIAATAPLPAKKLPQPG